MTEFRQNLATKEWVIVAPGRANRPRDIKRRITSEARQRPTYKPDCAFCPGNEHHTTTPVWNAPNEPAPWQVRVVPNKYAALNRDQEPNRKYDGRYLAADGFGIADVVIEHPRHDLSPATMDVDDVALFLTAYRQRHLAIDRDDRINLVTIFRNHGLRAGTSLEHPHSQLIATPIVPPHVRDSIEQAVRHYDKHGTCVYCDMLAEEMRRRIRIVAETEHFVAFCPYASRSPYECRIYPKRHQPAFFSLGGREIADLAGILKGVLLRLYDLLDDPDYNYIIRSAPSGDQDARYLHWYMVIIPKISTPAGFEIGTGIYINTTAPEQAAEDLRETLTPTP